MNIKTIEEPIHSSLFLSNNPIDNNKFKVTMWIFKPEKSITQWDAH